MTRDCTINGKCSRCGGCCLANPPITLQEYYTIKDYIAKKKPLYLLQKPYNNSMRFDCCFHVNGGCTIYPVRPAVCRNFLCSHTPEVEHKDKLFYDKRADINGNHYNRFIPMDLLFYDYPVTTMLMCTSGHICKPCKTQEELIMRLRMLGADREFFKKHPDIPNTNQIADAIINGDIIIN